MASLLTFFRAVIILTLCIYIRAGRDIWVKREQLRNFPSDPIPTPSPPRMNDPFAGKGITQTKQFSVNYESASPTDSVSQLNQQSNDTQYPAPPAKPENTFTVNISGAHPISPNTSRWSYAEKHDNGSNNSRASATFPPAARRPSAAPPRQYTANEANTAIWSYTKVSLLFFVAMMVTWIPSSANRAYSAAHTDEVSLPLEYMSALVLPLQGFWNAIIYATTSLQACKQLSSTIRQRNPFTTGKVTNYAADDDREHHGAARLPSTSGGMNNKTFFNDASSETELQPRPITKDSTSF